VKRHGLRISSFLLAVSLLAAHALAADGGTGLHATILARVLSYELSLEERAGNDVGIAVVYKPGDAVSEASATAWMQALEELASEVQIKNRRVVAVRVPNDPDQLSRALDKYGIDVVLAAEGLGADARQVANFTRAHHLLSVGSTVAYIEADLTLCVQQEADRPRIFVNLNNANLESVRFSSNILKLAKLIR